MRDPRAVEAAGLLPRVRYRSLVERLALDVLRDEESERSARRGDEHVRRAYPVVAREQHRVRLVLDLLPPRREERRRRVAEGDPPPDPCHELCVSLVPSERHHPERTVGPVGEEHGARDGLLGGGAHVLAREPERGERALHLFDGGSPRRRPEQQVYDRADAPSEDDGTQDVGGE